MSHNITKALPGLGVAPDRRWPATTDPLPARAAVRWRARGAEQGEETAGEGSGPSDGPGADQMARVNSSTATTTAATATRKKNIATFAALAITLIQA